MADNRGLVASYPFVIQAPEKYQPRNEERFRAQMAQANADIFDRLANVETDVDAVEQALATLPPPPTVPDFATGAEALDGTSPDTIISPATLKVVLDDLPAPSGAPVGTVSYFAGDNPPGWLNCDGAVVTSLYPDLRAYLIAAGSPYGVSGADPRLPDLRGEFIRGADLGRGVDPGRVFGSLQLDQLQRLVGQLVSVQTIGTSLLTSGILRQLASTASAIWQGATAVNRNTTLQLDTQFDPTVRSGTETRPRNLSLRACIKAFDVVNIEGAADLDQLLTAIATTAEARTGTNNTKLMTPAATAARSGTQVFNDVTGLSTVTFDQVPPEAGELDLIFSFVQYPANGAIRLDFSGAVPATRVWSTRTRFDTGAYIPPGGEDDVGSFLLDTAAASNSLTGTVRLVRDQLGGLWTVTGSLRRSSAAMLVYAGVMSMSGGGVGLPRITAGGVMAAGRLACKWRI